MQEVVYARGKSCCEFPSGDGSKVVDMNQDPEFPPKGFIWVFGCCPIRISGRKKEGMLTVAQLGPPVVPFYRFFLGGGFPY